ncbi:MAG: IS66 family transposase [Chloroflexota bacterium]
MDLELLDHIPLPRELLEHTPEPVLVFILQHMAENQLLRASVAQLEARVEQLEAKLNKDSSNSNKPPSSDSPFKAKSDAAPAKPKSKRRRKGHRQQCLRPSEIQELFPGRCACGCSRTLDPEPYYIHQLIELPVINLLVRHIILYRARCAGCGKTVKAVIPPAQRSGFGPRLSALIAELCGAHGDSRRAVQDFLLSVLGLPISQGGVQKVLDRVSAAIAPHYAAIEDVARAAPVNHVDETSWRRKGRLAWLWVMTCARAALFMIHAKRSKAAFEALVKDWTGILVADGYGVYRNWVGRRQSCLAHLIREAKGLAERRDSEQARCGTWAREELRRLCRMAKEPPSVGEWNMFYARFIRLVSMYGDRKDDAGKLARRLRDEMEHLWLFLWERGVSPTNNHAERMLRFAVLWRKRSLGTMSDRGERWAERILSLRQTCRLQGVRTYLVLVNAMGSFFSGKHPDLAWISSAP